MSSTTDTVITVALFVALIPAVALAAVIGLHLLMLGDRVSTRRGFAGVLVGVIGIPLAAIIVYLVAALLAWSADGYSFYYPIVALVVGAAVTVGLSGLADRMSRDDRVRADRTPTNEYGRDSHRRRRPDESVGLPPERVMERPWDFVLYRKHDGSHVLEVMFSEGVHKIDVARYFALDSTTGFGSSLDQLSALAAQIREDFPNTGLRQVNRHDLEMPEGAARDGALVPIRFGQSGLRGREAELLTEHPTNDAGVPIEFPIGTRRVVILDDTPGPMMTLRVHPVGNPRIVGYIDHALLGLDGQPGNLRSEGHSNEATGD